MMKKTHAIAKFNLDCHPTMVKDIVKTISAHVQEQAVTLYQPLLHVLAKRARDIKIDKVVELLLLPVLLPETTTITDIVQAAKDSLYQFPLVYKTFLFDVRGIVNAMGETDADEADDNTVKEFVHNLDIRLRSLYGQDSPVYEETLKPLIKETLLKRGQTPIEQRLKLAFIVAAYDHYRIPTEALEEISTPLHLADSLIKTDTPLIWFEV